MSNSAEGFGVGLLVGVILGVLFAPRSGKENRAILAKGFEAFKERVLEGMKEAEEKSLWALERSADTVERTAEAVRVKSAGAALKMKGDRLVGEAKSS